MALSSRPGAAASTPDVALTATLMAATAAAALVLWRSRLDRPVPARAAANTTDGTLEASPSSPSSSPRKGYASLIGNTPMVELASLSALTGRTILAKAEHLNPGGTGKDRIARAMIEEAEARGLLGPAGGTVVEGTSGSTGIALAALCAAKGYRCVIVMPDDQAEEKRATLRRFGATVQTVRTAAIANPEHYVNQARKLAQDTPGAYFTDQFETMANYRAHLLGTGVEILHQAAAHAAGRAAGAAGAAGASSDGVDAFVMSAGTGGTIAGVSRCLKRARPGVKVVLADPPGSSLYHWVKHGVCWAAGGKQAERKVKKHRYDTIAEGIGLDRITANLAEVGAAAAGATGGCRWRTCSHSNPDSLAPDRRSWTTRWR